MRKSLVLTTLTAVGLVLSMTAHAQDARSTLDAQSMSSAQVQTESKGFFSGISDRMHGMFRKHDSAAIDTQTMADTDMGDATVTNETSTSVTTGTDDTIDNNEEVTDESAATGSADVDTGAGVSVGGVNADIGVSTDTGVDVAPPSNDALTGGGVGVQTNTNGGVHTDH